MATTHPLTNPERNAAVGDGIEGRRRYVRYLLWALLVPGVLWVLAFPLVTSKSYENWGETEWGPVLEYPYLAGTPDADVVVWGDSSAFIGLDPRVVNQQLGVSTVVLPSTVGSLPVLGDAPLRFYLEHHKRPELLVLYFSAWNLDFEHMAPGRHFEGEEMLLRHSTMREKIAYGLRHPVEVIAFPIRLYSTFGSHMLMEALHGKSREAETLASLGHAPFNEPYPALSNLCRFPAALTKSYGAGTLDALRQQYEAMGFRVMVYVAPVPNCTNSGAVHDRATYATVGAAPPALLPPTDFAGDNYYAHIWPAFVPASSRVFAEALRGELGKGQRNGR